jgi:hypothetical protein
MGIGSGSFMKDKRQYLKDLTALIRERYMCEAVHRRTVMVEEKLNDQATWKGEVEVFFLPNHPTSRRCYVWERGSSPTSEVQIVFETPPTVIGPATAVRAAAGKAEQAAMSEAQSVGH